MTKNYTTFKNSILLLFVSLIGLGSIAQDLNYSFANASITNDGTSDYYEIDVMVQSNAGLKLGSGNFSISYNTAAFGAKVSENSAITIIDRDNSPGYVCSTKIDAASIFVYNAMTTADATNSVVTISIPQVMSSTTFAANNVTATPAKLCRLKFKYTDVNQFPLLSFRTNNPYVGQFTTACGSAGGNPFDTADCGMYPGTAITTETFDSTFPPLASHIKFSFANAQNINDGVDDFYEVDVMVQTVYNTPEFKLGAGKLGFSFNGNAFGTNINAGGSFEVTHPNPDYIAGQLGDPTPVAVYHNFTTDDVDILTVSWAFDQQMSTVEIPDNNVKAMPAKLCHLKLKYKVGGLGLDPQITFNQSVTDQFSTACGGVDINVDCTNFPGVVLTDDIYDSSASAPTLSNASFKLVTGLSLYPNPANNLVNLDGDISKIKSIEIYSLSGQRVMDIKNNFKTIDISNLTSSIYFVKLATDNAVGTLKLMKQ